MNNPEAELRGILLIKREMKRKSAFILVFLSGLIFISCTENTKLKKDEKAVSKTVINTMKMDDKRISLKLNPMQKQHQLKNMRSHLEAVQTILDLLSTDNYDEASKVAYTKLGSTTEMKLMCASFGNEEFENLGLNFHASADQMSEIFKNKDKNSSLAALSNTTNYCVQCHAIFRQ